MLLGSLGPYGACLGDGSEYSGNYIDKVSREDLKTWHLERIRRLAVRKVDLFAAETIPSLEEALAIIDALDEVPGAVGWISFSCRDGESTARGEKMDEVFRKLLQHPSFRFDKFTNSTYFMCPNYIKLQFFILEVNLRFLMVNFTFCMLHHYSSLITTC